MVKLPYYTITANSPTRSLA